MNCWCVLSNGSVLGLVLLTNCLPLYSNGMTTNVTIGNDFFSPSSVSIQANDSVKWTWAAGSHSTTSSTGLWDSGVRSAPSTFTNTFASTGTFSYICTVHGNMVGAVKVA